MKMLYFVCPTDCLESVIDQVFREENYYYSSLGNSISFDQKMLKQTMSLIETRKIGEIAFVLSNDNRIVLDALGDQDFSNIRGLDHFYNQIINQRRQVEMSWKTWDPKFFILSYYLNMKIKELKKGLKDANMGQLEISGKVYDKRKRTFSDIYSDFICMEYSSLN